MKRLNYILLLLLGVCLFSSCGDGLDPLEGLDDTLTIASFESYSVNMGGEANGSEYNKVIQVKVNGPGIMDLTEDVTMTVAAAANSTAIEGVHYRIENKSITLSRSNNYQGLIDIVLMTEGNTPPMDGTPEFDDYKAPVLFLNAVSVEGGNNTVATGKTAKITLNFTPPNPYAGEYDVELRYFHPNEGSYPDNLYGGVRSLVKELTAITGRKCETGFAVWGDSDLCWITINADNSISFVVDDTWPYSVKLGIPEDPSKISHYDPATGKIYLYYHYSGSGGNRIFWEVFTPKN